MAAASLAKPGGEGCCSATSTKRLVAALNKAITVGFGRRLNQVNGAQRVWVREGTGEGKAECRKMIDSGRGGGTAVGALVDRVCANGKDDAESSKSL